MSSKLLTIADLAERWGCTPATAMGKVRDKGVPFVWLGKGEPKLKTAGTKFIRFRPEALEAFERAQERVWVEPTLPETTAAVRPPRGRAVKPERPPMSDFLRDFGWDGKVR